MALGRGRQAFGMNGDLEVRRRDGNDQYLRLAGDFGHYRDDPHTPRTERPPLTGHRTVVCVGGGFAGLVAAARVPLARSRPRPATGRNHVNAPSTQPGPRQCSIDLVEQGTRLGPEGHVRREAVITNGRDQSD